MLGPLNIRSIPSKTSDASMLYPKIQPALASFHKLSIGHMNISPNLITCFGLLCIIGLLNLSLWGCAGFNTIIGIPFFAPLCALCIGLYYLSTCFAEMQGKKVGMYEHPMREIFAQATGAVAVAGISLATLHLLKASNWAAAMLMFSALSATLLAHTEQMATGTWNFPPGLGNVTNLNLGAMLLFLCCSILPIPSIHIPFTNFNIASIVAFGALACFGTQCAALWTRSPEAVKLALPGIASFAVAFNTWWWSQPHFLNRFTFMGCVAPCLCYIWSTILGKFSDKRPSPQSALIPLAAALLNVYFHSTVKGFFLTCGIFAFTDLFFPAMIYRAAGSLKMSHWWGVQLDNEVLRLGKQQKQEEKKVMKQKEREEREKQAKIEQEEKEKRMIEDEKQGFLTVGKHGKVVHPRKAEEETKQANDQHPQNKQNEQQNQNKQQNAQPQANEQQAQKDQKSQQTSAEQQREHGEKLQSVPAQQQSEPPAQPTKAAPSNASSKIVELHQQDTSRAPEGEDSTMRRRAAAANKE